MDRKTKIDKHRQPDGQIRRSRVLKVETTHLDIRFWFIERPFERTETGLLQFLTFYSPHPSEPRFEARIDDGPPSRRKALPEIDFDIENVTNKIKTDFKAGRNGYAGHRSVRSSNANVHTYHIRLEVPGRRIFEGTVTIALTSLVGITESLHATDTVDAVVSKAKS